MKKWIVEDWEFTITVKEGEAEHCRLGFETGDVFSVNMKCRADSALKRWQHYIHCAKQYGAVEITDYEVLRTSMKLIFPVLMVVFAFI